jgi:hypothetical protein
VLTNQPAYQALLGAGHTSGDNFKVSDKYKTIQPHWKRSRQANFSNQLRAFDPAPAPRPGPAAAKVDCAVSTWGPWSDWIRVDDQTDSRKRTRQVTTQAAGGGNPCPELEETGTRERPPGPPAVDCQVSDWSPWSDWASTSATSETRTRTRTVTRPQANGGQPCGPLSDTDRRNVRPTGGGGGAAPPKPPPPPDSDRDSVADNLDACPDTAPGTTVDATGCPLAPVTPTAAGTAPTAAPAIGVGGLQGRLIAFLDSLLRQGASRTVDVQDAPVSYSGPNAELLRLQQEVIGLALKALALPPRGSGTPPPGGGGGG